MHYELPFTPNPEQEHVYQACSMNGNLTSMYTQQKQNKNRDNRRQDSSYTLLPPTLATK